MNREPLTGLHVEKPAGIRVPFTDLYVERMCSYHYFIYMEDPSSLWQYEVARFLQWILGGTSEIITDKYDSITRLDMHTEVVEDDHDKYRREAREADERRRGVST